MAGTVTVLETTFAPVKKIKWSWTSTAGGAADLITVNALYGCLLYTSPSPRD